MVVGAGQQPGETIGNGKAIALTFAREGAEVLCVDRDRVRAEATVAEIVAAGGTAFALGADIVSEADAIVAAALERWGRVDICVETSASGTAMTGRRTPTTMRLSRRCSRSTSPARGGW